MTDPAFNPALRKIILAHAAARIRKVPRPAGLEPAVGRAVARTSNAFEGLLAETSEISIDWDRRLADALDVLPEQRLLAVLEGGAQTRALCVLENTIVDALIEVQTTGSVDAQTGAARPTTKIDAAIARDFIDFLLSHLGHELTIAVQSGIWRSPTALARIYPTPGPCRCCWLTVAFISFGCG
jgi:flagellar motor switch protein FliM